MYQLDFNNPCRIFFVGIGGISMSGLAEILSRDGFTVSGSDRSESDITQALEKSGIRVFYGQRTENITPDLDLVVFTAAIREDNPEYIETLRLGLPTLSRAELLGQMMKHYGTSIAISGTHGKTTATSMISEILLHADTDPTLSIGGVLPSIGSNVRVGGPDYFVVEACEYTNSFLSFFPKIEVILNIEEDHLDFFKDLDDIRSSFRRFAQLLPKDGALVINADIPKYREITDGLDCRIVTYGSSEIDEYGNPVDYFATDITFDALAHASFRAHTPKGIRSFTLRVPGSHNVGNSLAAIAVADIVSIEDEPIAEALSAFTGTNRRFEYKGTWNEVTIVDDYAHHPTEIMTTMKTAKAINPQRLVVVFQPHTYTRTKAFFDDFANALKEADLVILADVYAARETDTLGVSSELLSRRITEFGGNSLYFPSFEEIEKYLLKNCRVGDLLITMGAGEAYKIGDFLLSQ